MEEETKPQKVKKPLWKRWWVWVLAFFVFLIIIGSFADNGDEPGQAEPQVEPEMAVEELEEIVEEEDVDVELEEEIEVVEVEEEPIEQVAGDGETYRMLLVDNASNMGDALSELGWLSENMEYTDEWVLKAATQVAVIRYYADEAQKIVPPEQFKEIHELYLQGTEKFRESMDWYVEGVDELNPTKIEKSGELMEQGSQYIRQATAKLP